MQLKPGDLVRVRRHISKDDLPLSLWKHCTEIVQPQEVEDWLAFSADVGMKDIGIVLAYIKAKKGDGDEVLVLVGQSFGWNMVGNWEVVQ